MNAVLLSVTPPGHRLPGWLGGILILIAVIPLLTAYIAFVRYRVGRAMGLIKSIPTRAVLDPSGIELSLDGSAAEVHRWEDIVTMEKAGKDWRLVGSDGSTVVAIPAGLALPRPSWSDAPTLAEAIVEMRPDRFALRLGGTFEVGLTEFDLRESGDPVGRPRVAMNYSLVAGGAVLFVIAFFLLVILLEQPR